MAILLRPRLQSKLLSEEECARVRAIAADLAFETALTGSGVTIYRRGQVAWLGRSSDTQWLFDRIDRFARSYAGFVGLDVSQLEEPLQIAQYGRSGHFDWHIDVDLDRLRFRKITVAVQLSDGNSYRGGDLEIVGETSSVWRRAQGLAIAFPSILGHRVTRTSRGTRHALVAWMLGPPLR